MHRPAFQDVASLITKSDIIAAWPGSTPTKSPITSAKAGSFRAGGCPQRILTRSLFDRNLKPVDGKTRIAGNLAQRPLWLLKGLGRSGNDFEVGCRH